MGIVEILLENLSEIESLRGREEKKKKKKKCRDFGNSLIGKLFDFVDSVYLGFIFLFLLVYCWVEILVLGKE